MAEQLEARYAEIMVKLIPGSGGAFEVQRDGEPIFSKHRFGRFPTEEEIFAILDG